MVNSSRRYLVFRILVGIEGPTNRATLLKGSKAKYRKSEEPLGSLL